MAQKRMFTMKIVDSDAFLDMPLSAQCLYFHLNMRADDDGFIGNPKRIMRTVGCRDDDMKILVSKKFLLVFDSGVIVIKHWRMHNFLAKDRYHEIQYIDEKDMLRIKQNKSYSLTHGEPLSNPGIIDVEEEEASLLTDSKAVKKSSNYSDDFEAFWKEYPRKADKGQAYRKYQARIKSGYSSEELLKAAQNYKLECDRKHTQTEYIKHAKTFLGDATPFVDYLPSRNEETCNTKKASFEDFI